ncbi:hypothetical protein EYR40_006745 [Pleurotus pulmonarius]|nr:hypothetical protein EYR36_011366 [Pleurotus pulmonarius]KAF4598394.1 hypothetical protein EYR38_006796 [Pleurotus pulmonarius]KAF4599646.1 hypothetical protein EYR40_006745 [Pleurotus pulmonarius]
MGRSSRCKGSESATKLLTPPSLIVADPTARKYPSFASPVLPDLTANELCGASANNAVPFPWSRATDHLDSSS